MIFKKISSLVLGLLFFTLNLQSQPMQNRILIATSSNGMDWSKLNKIASDSGDVPDALVGPDNNTYLYYQGIRFPIVDRIMVAISSNGIDGWVYYKVQIQGTDNWKARPCDPDVIFKDNLFRLYFTGDPTDDKTPETYSAISTDGINFTLEKGVRFEVQGYAVLDPSLLRINDTLIYFAGGSPTGQNWHGYSLDGLLFYHLSDFSINNIMMANGIKTGNGYRFYGFNNIPPTSIYSVFSVDGRNWILEQGYRLKYDPGNTLESQYVKDPAIIYKDGQYIMYYVTRKLMSQN